MTPRRCSMRPGCKLATIIAAHPEMRALARAFANVKADDPKLAVLLHEEFGIDPVISVQLADALIKAIDNPPSDCVACECFGLAA